MAELYEDAVEAALHSGRGMKAHQEFVRRNGKDCESLRIDLMDEFRRLSPEQRRLGDHFALVSALVPAALLIVRRSLTDAVGAKAACIRVAAACRQLE